MRKLVQNQSSRKFFGNNADLIVTAGEKTSTMDRDSGFRHGRIGNKILHSDISATFIGFGLQVDESSKNIRQNVND